MIIIHDSTIFVYYFVILGEVPAYNQIDYEYMTEAASVPHHTPKSHTPVENVKSVHVAVNDIFAEKEFGIAKIVEKFLSNDEYHVPITVNHRSVTINHKFTNNFTALCIWKLMNNGTAWITRSQFINEDNHRKFDQHVAELQINHPRISELLKKREVNQVSMRTLYSSVNSMKQHISDNHICKVQEDYRKHEGNKKGGGIYYKHVELLEEIDFNPR